MLRSETDSTDLYRVDGGKLRKFDLFGNTNPVHPAFLSESDGSCLISVVNSNAAEEIVESIALIKTGRDFKRVAIPSGIKIYTELSYSARHGLVAAYSPSLNGSGQYVVFRIR